LFPHDREKEIETEKGLEGREREILHITPKQKAMVVHSIGCSNLGSKREGVLKKRGEGWEEV